MKIEDFEFGSIKINGIKYQQDLIITPKGIIPNWWRKEGHKIFWEDLSFLNFEGIKYLIIGTGWSGAVQIQENLKEKMRENNIRIISVNSKKAIKEYENYKNEAILALHLTC